MEGAGWITWAQAMGATALVSVVSLLGAFLLTLRPRTLDDNLHLLVSFAVGALFGDAFIHLLPEAFERSESDLGVSLLILLGIFLFMAAERLILWQQGDEGHGSHPGHGMHGAHSHGSRRAAGGKPRPIVLLNLVGDGIHNLVDGLLIGASFMASPALGMTTTLAVLLHEIPQELGDFGVLVHGGLSHRKALGFNFLSAITALAGTALSLAAGPYLSGYETAMLPVTAGGFIYLAGSTLIPDLLAHVKPRDFLKELLAMAAGVAVMAALALAE
jgi:zinc and cadmium transporter